MTNDHPSKQLRHCVDVVPDDEISLLDLVRRIGRVAFAAAMTLGVSESGTVAAEYQSDEENQYYYCIFHNDPRKHQDCYDVIAGPRNDMREEERYICIKVSEICLPIRTREYDNQGRLENGYELYRYYISLAVEMRLAQRAMSDAQQMREDIQSVRQELQSLRQDLSQRMQIERDLILQSIDSLPMAVAADDMAYELIKQKLMADFSEILMAPPQ